MAVLEQPFALPMEARQTTLAIGRNAGIIEGVLAALGIPKEAGMSITTRPPATAWIGVTCTDDRLRGLHRRHYSSEKSGRRRGRPVEHPNQLRMIGPGEYLALLTLDASAGFIWRRSRYRKDGQLGVECTLFRNERGRRCEDRSHGHNSVRLIEEAVALAWAKWPGERLFTHVNPERVNAMTPGYCFILAGFRALDERTRAGLVVLERLPGGAP